MSKTREKNNFLHKKTKSKISKPRRPSTFKLDDKSLTALSLKRFLSKFHDHKLYMEEDKDHNATQYFKFKIHSISSEEQAKIYDSNKQLSYERYKKFSPLIYPDILSKVNSINPSSESHTLFSDAEELKNVVDLRLGSALKGALIDSDSIIAFVGGREDLFNYMQNADINLKYEIDIPSTGKYYIGEKDGKLYSVLSGLQSTMNLYSQLCTMKYAGVDCNKVKIVGDVNYFDNCIDADVTNLTNFLSKNGISLQNISSLIIAGDYDKLNQEIVKESDIFHKKDAIEFSGQIIKLKLYKSSDPDFPNSFVLSMPYGETMKSIIKKLSPALNVGYVFNAGAGGALPDKEIDVGDCVVFSESLMPSGSLVPLSGNLLLEVPDICKKVVHEHVSSPFDETRDWMQKVDANGASVVDVETHFLFQALNELSDDDTSNDDTSNDDTSNDDTNTNEVTYDSTKKQKYLAPKLLSVLFISDVISKHPLRAISHENAYKNLGIVLKDFFNKHKVRSPDFYKDIQALSHKGNQNIPYDKDNLDHKNILRTVRTALFTGQATTKDFLDISDVQKELRKAHRLKIDFDSLFNAMSSDTKFKSISRNLNSRIAECYENGLRIAEIEILAKNPSKCEEYKSKGCVASVRQ